jgi:hypothetical protein
MISFDVEVLIGILLPGCSHNSMGSVSDADDDRKKVCMSPLVLQASESKVIGPCRSLVDASIGG